MIGRKINLFEKILLPVGIGLTFLGFYMIILADRDSTMGAYLRLTSVFCWIILLFIVIMCAAMEDMKEELSLIQKEHMTEIKLLREVVHEQLQEIRLLRQDLTKKK